MIKKIDHVAVIVKDIDEAVKSYSGMFEFKIIREMEGPGGEFKSAMISVGDITLEFFQPLKPGTSFARFLEEEGGGLHHVSFTTDDIAGEMKALMAQGRKLQNEELISLPSGDKVAFVHPEATENVLIELVQRA